MGNIDYLKDKTILVTGATGSFGKNFIKHIIQYSEAKKIVAFSRDELKQYHMSKEIQDPRIRFFIGDVRDRSRLSHAFRGIDIVVHAAALKQVPILEYNPFEAVQTNVMGSQNVIEAAIAEEVEKVLLISTDKAAQPVNLYGSTKLCAEKLFVSGNVYSGGGTKFSCVRYGNVIASRGSIVETLLAGKAKGEKKFYITDESMTRFWLTLGQAVDLVLYALSEMLGGEIFVPKAPSMAISDLFKAVVPEAEVEVMGIRPGEKLHEVLLTEQEGRHAVDIGDYFVVLPEFVNRQVFEKKYAANGPVERGFSFTSNDNPRWLSAKEFLTLAGIEE